MSESLSRDYNSSAAKSAVSEAVLTEAVRHVDVIHISLAGMLAIVVTLLVALALPVFGLAPVTHPGALVTMFIASSIGIGGLYYLNYQVHQHVANQARLTEVLVNSLGQGFLVFDKAGICGSVYSQACISLLETVPAEKHIADVLCIPADQRSDFQDWLEILFQPDHALGFDDAIKFFPAYFPHSQQWRVHLVYRPIRNKEGELINIVLIATDQTEEYEAQQDAKRQQAYAEMICRIFKERNQFQATVTHVREFIAAASVPTVGVNDSPSLLRQLHTLKATVKQFNLMELASIIHDLESDLRAAGTADSIFREKLSVGREKIADALLRVTDEVKNLLGNEVEWRNSVREIDEAKLYDFARKMKTHNADPALIQTYLTTIAAVPIRDCFNTFERELSELASALDKQLRPVIYSGDNPRVLTQPIQEFLFSLTHICRNIVDHGIEPPVTRMARGKEPAGTVTIHTNIVKDATNHEWIRIVISDDGNGIDPSRIRSKLANIDPDGSWRHEDDQTVIQRIFSWGVTTAETLTTFSGRGVGMEAVEREVKLLGGSIQVTSELYKGASFDIRLPYHLDLDQVGKSEVTRLKIQA